MSAFVELSHVIEDGMPVLPGILDPPRVGAVLSREESRPRYRGLAEFLIGRYEMPANVGTYMDSPFHRHPDGEDLSRIPLERVAGLPGVLVESSRRDGPVELPPDLDVAGRAVLVRTGWDERWPDASYWEPGPFLAERTIDRLIDRGAALVGVDFVNVDDTSDPSRPAHTRLLEAGVLIVECMVNLGALPSEGFRFQAVPLRIAGGASFPVRAFAELD